MPQQTLQLQPKVNLEQRKRTDVFCSVIFIICFLIHLVFIILYAASTNVYFIDNDDLVSLYPKECKTSTDCSIDILRSSTICDFGQASFRSFINNVEPECRNPCKSGYIFYAAARDYPTGFCTSIEKGDIKRCYDLDREQATKNVVRHLTTSDLSKELSVGQVLKKTLFPFIMFLLAIFVLLFGWSYAMLKSTTKTVWASVLVLFLLSTVLCIWFMSEVPDSWPCLVAIGLTGLYFAWRHKDISKASLLLQEACHVLSQIPSIFGWTLLFQLSILGYICLNVWALFESLQIFKVEVVNAYMYSLPFDENDIVCQLSPKSWVGPSRFFNSIIIIWTVLLLNHFRTGLIAGSLSVWYFHLGTVEMPQHPSKVALSWVFTSSFGTHCYSSLILALITRLQYCLQNKWFSYSNPLGWMCLVLGKCLKTLIESISRFALIVHVISGLNYCRSGKQVYYLVKDRLKSALAVIALAEFVLNGVVLMINFIINIASFLGLASYLGIILYADSSANTALMLILYFTIAAIFALFPFLTLLFVYVILSDAFTDSSTLVSLLAVALILGLIARILFQFIASIMTDGLSTLYITTSISDANHFDHPLNNKVQSLFNYTPLVVGYNNNNIHQQPTVLVNNPTNGVQESQEPYVNMTQV